MIKRLILRAFQRLGYDLVPIQFTQATQRLVLKPLDPREIELLADPAFQDSCRAVYALTLLDTPRLANLWQLARLSHPAGHLLEVGSYRGGSALHLSNACPDRRLFVCDSFAGFRALDPQDDRAFNATMFRDATREDVERLFAGRGRAVTVVAGYFPESCAGLELGPLSFVHLDVDTYEATRGALAYLPPLMSERALMVVDDYQRTAKGVDRALAEFVQAHSDWALFPLFPSQALLAHRSWWQDGSAAAGR
jgi:predicted O-methyltransferase YrrM